MDIAVLAIDLPSRLVMAQVEESTLLPCQEDETRCTTVLRLLVRDVGAPSDALVPALQDMPFVRVVAGKGR